MSIVFEPIRKKNFVAKNRLVRSGSWEGNADQGKPSYKQYQIYDRLSKGGIGTIIVSGTKVVDFRGNITRNLMLDSRENLPAFSKLADLCKQNDTQALIQLAHDEYYRRGGDGNLYEIPQADMTTEDMKTVVRQFVEAAQIAYEAGFHGVQIHAAHGFWLTKFLHPSYNRRTDEYGQERLKILFDMADSIRQATSPFFGIHVKIDSNERDELMLEADRINDCVKLGEHGFHSIEISGGIDFVRKGIRAGENESYYEYFSAALKKETEVPVILVGGNRSYEKTESIIAGGKADCVSFCRPLICEPELPDRWERGDRGPSKCISCNQCMHTPAHVCFQELKRV